MPGGRCQKASRALGGARQGVARRDRRMAEGRWCLARSGREIYGGACESQRRAASGKPANREWRTGNGGAVGTTRRRAWPTMRHPVGFELRAGTRPAPTPCLQQCVTERPRMFPARCRGGPCGRPWCDSAFVVPSGAPHRQGGAVPGPRCGIPSDSNCGQAQGLPLHRVCSSASPKGHGCFLRDVGAALVAARGGIGQGVRRTPTLWCSNGGSPLANSRLGGVARAAGRVPWTPTLCGERRMLDVVPHVQRGAVPGPRCGIPSDSKHGQAQGLPLHFLGDGVRSLDTHYVVAAHATTGEWRMGVPPARCVDREARWCGGVLAAVLVATLGCRLEAWATQHREARVAGVSGFGFRSAAQIKRGAASVSYDPAVAARSAEARSVGHAHACAASAESLPCNSSTVISRGVNSRMRCPVTPRPQLTYRVEPPSRNSPRS